MNVILPAVDARNLHLSYQKKTPVLQGVNLLVKRGHIYGLLGPSGCGKTTLLKCVLGRLKPKRGRINVLGHQPGTYESKIPGSRVGYMPQELALYQDFTVSETLHFFGRVHKMSGNEIKGRMKFLLSFLDIPSADRRVSQLSGGQQRRVSLAIALLHSPEILILDEPTVGVDPLLRQRIWDHLVGIATTNGCSIIITTHYIEEARSANTVGLMRSGRILAEGPPDLLLERFNQSTLEDVFLHLCMIEDQYVIGSMERGRPIDSKTSLVKNRERLDEVDKLIATRPDVAMIDPSQEYDDGDVRILGASNHNDSRRTESYISYTETETCAHRCQSYFSNFPSGRNISALVIKNFNQMKRRIGFLLFQFLLPAIQITIYCFSIGGTPKSLPVSINNMDEGVLAFGLFNISFSEAFVSQLDTSIISKHYVNDTQTGIDYIRNGSSWCLMEFGKNFSSDTLAKYQPSEDRESYNGSILHIWSDSTNQQITVTIQAQILSAYQHIIDGLKLQVPAGTPFPSSFSSEIPIKYEKPVYGLEDATFLDFVAPGIVCSIVYFLAIGLTTLSLVLERKEGLFERSLVSGVTVAEIITGHIITQFLVMIVQMAVLLVFTFIVFGVYNAGPMVVTVLFALMIGILGMCMGFVISTVTSNESEATQLALALMFPFLLISGILWPIEAMPKWLQYISMCTPLTLPVEGLRSVIGRGWDLTYYIVWRGFLVVIGYSIFFLLISLIFAKFKRLT